MSLALGLDFGTSGARAIVIDQQGQIQAQARYEFDAQTVLQPKVWQAALNYVMTQLPLALRQKIRRIAINGTSGTVLLCNAQGQPTSPVLLYNDARAGSIVSQQTLVPADHLVQSGTSSLAKLLWLCGQGLTLDEQFFLHQADWLSYLLHGKLGLSDEHNSLKLGYDPALRAYPSWLLDLPLPTQIRLPRVLIPGTPIALVQAHRARQWQLPSDCLVCAGTTDSIAAFLASGAQQIGQAVTSLGSTLVVKLLSEQRIDAGHFGIYSHRLGDHWLVGGASNTGGAVLKKFFSAAQLVTLSSQIDLSSPSPRHYYPLLRPGERFPRHDPTLQPCLEPRPTDSVAFLYGLLESMARIEAEGYVLLQTLGAPPITAIYTAGGGAKNPTWTKIRARYLPVTPIVAEQQEAAYGTAQLAKTAPD